MQTQIMRGNRIIKKRYYQYAKMQNQAHTAVSFVQRLRYAEPKKPMTNDFNTCKQTIGMIKEDIHRIMS